MKFKRKYDYSKYRATKENLVRNITDGDSHLYSGELETLRRKVADLVDIVGFMVAQLPPEKVGELAAKFDWEEE